MMQDNPAVLAALDSLPMIPEPFGQRAINKLFRACIVASGLEWETVPALAMFDHLWQSDSVLSAVEEMREAHEAKDDTTRARLELVARIEAEIRGAK